MAINLIIDDKVAVKVEGSDTDAKGVIKPFEFTLICDRLDTEEIKAKQDSADDQSYEDFLIEVTQDWIGVRAEGGATVPYSSDVFRQLLIGRPALAALCFRRYMLTVAVQGKEKNSRG